MNLKEFEEGYRDFYKTYRQATEITNQIIRAQQENKVIPIGTLAQKTNDLYMQAYSKGENLLCLIDNDDNLCLEIDNGELWGAVEGLEHIVNAIGKFLSAERNVDVEGIDSGTIIAQS